MFVTPEIRAMPPLYDYDSFSLPDNFTLDFTFNAHISAQDLPAEQAFEKDITEADVVAPEMISGLGMTALLNKVSKGDYKTYVSLRDELGEHEFGGWLKGVLSAIYNSRTPITVLENHSVATIKLQKAEAARNRQLDGARTNGDVLESRPYLLESLQANTEREHHLLRSLEPRMKQLIQSNHRLATKHANQGLRVSIYYGSAHRPLLDGIRHKLDLSGPDSTTANETLQSNHGFVARDEIHSLYIRGLEIPDELLIAEAGRNLIYYALLQNPAFRDHKLPMAQGWLLVNEMLAATDVANDYPQMMDLARVVANMNIREADDADGTT